MSTAQPFIPSDATPADILRTGIEAAGGPVSLACSFSPEDVAIIDIAQRAGIPLGVFALDTGRLHEETYEVAEALVERYRLTIDWFFPRHELVERLEREKGLFSFRESLENRHECCHIRKVEPLSRALAGLSGWVTGMRRQQGVTRGELSAVEIDSLNNGILKINPLISWSEEQLTAYTEQYGLPRNRLLRQGYRSIGCAPCTRAVQPGEDARAGRWWWENAENKECGLHRR
ncbi:phosphoadenylyl-sulfate reductase [Trichlorobacter ammonificans]|uniref:Adenosine 5'-phosphosulfate reductase n=1 Tax=Trichlorobacter ammonificans TaxID=2916410 RepID=A0ABM9DC45_9BACT|nr:phosphoadenylyl-sulfate reductase [Trichlorobacter ammonificans]CAH2032400.1 Thioredoxin-dependent 5'-adenylylsulfate reductase [Trichlorobacter ammonificans]